MSLYRRLNCVHLTVAGPSDTGSCRLSLRYLHTKISPPKFAGPEGTPGPANREYLSPAAGTGEWSRAEVYP